MVARVALGGPPASLAPQPSAPAPTHRPEPRRPPPYAPQIDRRPSPLSRARRPRAAPSRPACRPAPPRGASSPRLLRPGGRVALEGVALRRVCPVGSPVRAGSSRPRGPLELDPPRLDSAWAPSLLGAWGRPSQLHGGFRRQCDAQKFGIWDKNCGHIWRASHLWAVGAPRKVSYKWLLGRRPSAAPCPAPRA